MKFEKIDNSCFQIFHESQQKQHAVYKLTPLKQLQQNKWYFVTVKKKWSSDREKFWKFEAEGREFGKILRSLEQFIQTVKVRAIFGNRMPF